MFSDAGSTPAASTSLRLSEAPSEDCRGVAKGEDGPYQNWYTIRLATATTRHARLFRLSEAPSEDCRGEDGQFDFPSKWTIDRGMDKTTYFYVYIIQSLVDPKRFYTGFTENIENRLKDHNSGKNSHTAELKPWRIKTAIAFTNRQKALDFETFLKTKSGRAFAKKRL